MRAFSAKKKRLISGIFFLLSAVAAYLSRKEEQIFTAAYSPEELMISRVAFVPLTTETVVRYVWEMAAVAGMLFITALIILVYSFKKNES